MNSKIVTLAIAVVSLAVVATTGNLSTMVYAEKPADSDCFGDSASDLAQGEPGMGEHSREGGAAGDQPFDDDDDKKGRAGIGNVGGGEAPDKTHPSDLAGALGGDCDEEED
jgi:hypothetical protein